MSVLEPTGAANDVIFVRSASGQNAGEIEARVAEILLDPLVLADDVYLVDVQIEGAGDGTGWTAHLFFITAGVPPAVGVPTNTADQALLVYFREAEGFNETGDAGADTTLGSLDQAWQRLNARLEQDVSTTNALIHGIATAGRAQGPRYLLCMVGRPTAA